MVVAALAGAAVLLASPWNGGSDSLARGDVVAYQEKLFPLVQEWGRLEMQGMRPAISDLDSPDEGVPPEAIAAEAEAWHEGLLEIKAKIAALPAPGRLADANGLFLRSIDRYIEAALLFRDAARADGEARRTGVDAGVKAASDGARIYNEASIILQAARRQAGLPSTEDFPNQPAGPRDVGSEGG